MKLPDQIAKIVQYFHQPKNTAKVAKERLQIIIAHERGACEKPDYLASLQRDLLDVIAKYVPIDKKDVQIDLEKKEGRSILELNVMLPEV